MSIHLAVAGLAYFLILVLAYIITIFVNLEEAESERIINKAFKNAYSILAIGLFVVYILFLLPPITIDNQTTSYLILISKFMSVFTLAGSLFVLNRRKNYNL